MDKLQIFRNGLFNDVRALLINDEPWFVGSDVTKALGYANHVQAIKNFVDVDDLMRSREMSKTNKELYFINESGVYSLIFNSKQERAKEFKRWVTHEVLPTLRRTGQYSTNKNVLSGDQAIELAKILSTVSPRNLPYVLSALNQAGYQFENAPALPQPEATQEEQKIRRGRHYPIDLELIKMLNQFHQDGMSMSELADRAYVPANVLYNVMRANSNTNPEFAARIKNTIREMYEERQ